MKSITVKSANHKYKATLKNGTVLIAKVASSYGSGWEKEESPVWFEFDLAYVLKHNSKKSHFVLLSVKDTGIYHLCLDRINNDSFAKIQNHFKKAV